VLLGGLSSTPQYIAVDANDDVYFTDNNSGTVYELPNSSSGYASAPISITTSLADAAGMTFDSTGDMYIVDSSTHIVYEIPYDVNTKALAVANIFPAAAGVNNLLSTARDGKTLLFSPAQYTGTNLFELVPGSVNAGAVAIGSTGTLAVNFLFSAAASPAAISVSSASGVFSNAGAGSCYATSYSAGSSCTVNVQFAPAAPGVATGSVVLTDASGNALATADISGTGTAAGLTVDPGVVTSFGSGYSAPTGVAVDNQGDVFFADTSQNMILEFPSGQSSAVALGSGLSAPAGVAVDGAGNVYVADTGNNRIVEIPIVNGSLSTAAQETVIASNASLAGTTLNSPSGIAIDGSGSLYIADTGNKRVVMAPYIGSWDLSLATTLGSSMSSPSAVAVDASGNVYVADAGNGDVYELTAPLSAGVQVTVASGYKTPSGLVADASGALFVVDRGNSKIWRIPNIAGSLTPASAVNVTGQLNAAGSAIVANPYGVALNSAGNLYVSDNMNAAAYVVNRSNSTQSFGTWNPGTTSGTLTYYLENFGNETLTLGSPYYAASGDTTQFSILSSTSGACAGSATVAAGSSCGLNAQFSPTVDGSYSDTLVLSSNAYLSGQQLVFTGMGATTTATTTTLAITSPSGSISYDQTVDVTATVGATTGTGTPLGSASLLVDGITKQTVTLSSSGTAQFTLAAGALAGGSHILEAQYSGGVTGFVTFSQSTSTPVNINVLPVATSTALSFTTLYINPVSQPAGTAINFTATISSAYAGAPTGTVTFTVTDSSGTIVTGTGTLQPASGGTFQATYTYANTTAPPSGTAYDVQSVVATYSGDANFTSAISTSASFDVSAASGSVTVLPSGTSITASTSSSDTINFTPTSYGGWNGLIGFSCEASSLPANARCIFAPGQTQVMASTAASPQLSLPVSLSIAIDQPSQAPTASGLFWWLAGPLGVLMLFTRRRFAQHARGVVVAMAALVLLGVAGLGIGGCSTSTQNLTPAGTSTITVYAWAQPFVAGSTTTTQTCPVIGSSTNPPVGNPAGAPCVQRTFQVSLTVQ
jgi:sugar lactone lactonase YvrE